MVKKKIVKKNLKKEAVLKLRRIKIKVIGAGGGAISILSELAQNLKEPKFLAFDTDQRSFRRLPRGITSLEFGRELTRGWGTGMNAELGEEAAKTVKEKLKKFIREADLVVLLACLGGGVGSGAAPVFAEVLREEKKLSLGIFTFPFNFEGDKKLKLAEKSLKSLKENLSGVLSLFNEEILKLADKKAPLRKSLSLMNQVLIGHLKDLIELICLPGLINIDFADIKTILEGRNQLVCFGRGIGSGPNRVEEAVKGVFNSPFFVVPPRLKKILFNISSAGDLSLKEVEEIARSIFSLNERAKIIFGISQNPKLGKKIKVSLLGVGGDIEEKEKVLKLKEAAEVKKNKKNKKEKRKKEASRDTEKKKEIFTKKVRRSALEVRQAEKEEKEKEWPEEPDWEIPTYLRKKM